MQQLKFRLADESRAAGNGDDRSARDPLRPAVTRASRPQGNIVLVENAQLGLFSQSTYGQQLEAEKAMQSFARYTWAFAAITRIAADISGLPFVVRKGPKPDDPEHPEDNALAALLNAPNPYMGFAELMEAITIYLEAAGRAPLFLETFSGNLKSAPVKELWPLRPSKTAAMLDQKDLVTGWLYRSSIGDQVFPAESVVQFSYFDPFFPIAGGMSQLSPPRVAAESGVQAWKWNGRWFTSGASPSMVVLMKRPLDTAYREQFKREIRTDWSGAENAFSSILLDNFDGEVNLVSPSHREMGFKDLMDMGREDVLAAIGVPPAIAGSFKGLNLAQVDMQERIYWTSKIIPQLRRIEGVINRGLAKRVMGDNAWFRFVTDDVKVLQPDLNAEAERNKTLVSIGLRTPNEIREEQGAKPYPEGNRYYIASNLTEIPTEQERAEKQARAQAFADKLGKENGKQDDSGGDQDDDGDQGDDDNTPPPPPPAKTATADLIREDMRAPKTLEERAAAWRGFNSMLTESEDALEAMWMRELGALADLVVARVRERPPVEAQMARADDVAGPLYLPDHVDSYLPNADEFARALSDKHSAIYKRIVRVFGQRAVFQLAKELAFDEGSPGVVAMVHRDHLRMRDRECYQLLEELRETLDAGMARSESIGTFVQRIRSTVGASPNTPARGGPTVRSQRIARTEAAAAANTGVTEGYRQTGVQYHEWLATHDGAARDSHLDMDTKRTKVGEPFQNGLMFPGDPSGPPEEVINCRCTTMPVLEGDE